MSNKVALLDLPSLADRLTTAPIGHTLHIHTSVPSTMPLAHALADQAPSGTIVLAEEQTQGRGRLRRRWDAPPGRGLLMSVLLKSPHLPVQPAQLPMIAGLAMVSALENLFPSLRGKVGLKWPNDILLAQDDPDKRTGGGERKVAGLLIESALIDDVMTHAVLGMGINVNQTADEFPSVPPSRPQPISLAIILGQPVDRADLLVAVCHALADLLAVSPPPTSPAIHAAWQDRLLTLGRTVTVSMATGQTFTGQAISTTPTGDLILQNPGGETRRFSAGDVTTAP